MTSAKSAYHFVTSVNNSSGRSKDPTHRWERGRPILSGLDKGTFLLQRRQKGLFSHPLCRRRKGLSSREWKITFVSSSCVDTASIFSRVNEGALAYHDGFKHSIAGTDATCLLIMWVWFHGCLGGILPLFAVTSETPSSVASTLGSQRSPPYYMCQEVWAWRGLLATSTSTNWSRWRHEWAGVNLEKNRCARRTW